MTEGGEYDIFHKTRVERWNEIIERDYNGIPYNVANKIWFQAIVSAVSTPENSLTFWNPNMNPQDINETFDLIIAPMANVFSNGYKELMEQLAEQFSKFKIPIYVIACGVQASSYDDLDILIEQIKIPAKKMITAVYQTGGEFALRGYFTYEFFKKLGFPSAVVTGCPSLYQIGNDIVKQLKVDKVSKEKFVPAFNGNLKYHIQDMKKYKNSFFIDQNTYYYFINSPKFAKLDLNRSQILRLCKQYSLDELEQISLGKVKLFPDMDDWKNFLQEKNVTFSYGGRIHGNVMALLSGIPAMVCGIDSRTSEMAEYFNIPLYSMKDMKKEDIYDIYLKADFQKFINKFPERLNEYERFLRDHHIIKNHINTNNVFLKKGEYVEICANNKKLEELNKEIKKHKILLTGFSKGIDIYRKTRGNI